MVLSPRACCWPPEARGADPVPPRATSPTKTTTPVTTTTRPTPPTRASMPAAGATTASTPPRPPAPAPARPRCSTAAASASTAARQLRRRHISVDGGHITVDAGRAVDAGGRSGTGSTTVREAVGQAIREAALGGVVCAGQATVTPQDRHHHLRRVGVGGEHRLQRMPAVGRWHRRRNGRRADHARRLRHDLRLRHDHHPRIHVHHHQPDLYRHRWSEDRDSQRDEHVDAHLLVWPSADHRQHPDQRRDSAVRERRIDDLRPDVHRDLHVLVDLAGGPVVHRRRNAERDGQEPEAPRPSRGPTSRATRAAAGRPGGPWPSRGREGATPDRTPGRSPRPAGRRCSTARPSRCRPVCDAEPGRVAPALAGAAPLSRASVGPRRRATRVRGCAGSGGCGGRGSRSGWTRRARSGREGRPATLRPPRRPAGECGPG